MKRLFLSAIFIAVAFLSTAQVINLRVTEFQETVIKNGDTTIRESVPFTATYIFDVTNDIITQIIDGNVTIASVFTFKETFDDGTQYIGLSYNDFPNCSWLINLTTKEVTYISSRSDFKRICMFDNSNSILLN